MIYSVWEWKARKGSKKASRFREALHDRVRFLPFVSSPSQALTRQLSQRESQGPAGKFLPLPLGEVSPQVTERASQLEKPLSRLRRQLSYKGETRRQMRVLDFCGRFAYNEITKEDRVPNFWTHEQTESPLGTANTEGASCLPGVSVCRAGGSTRGPRLLCCFGFSLPRPLRR